MPSVGRPARLESRLVGMAQSLPKPVLQMYCYTEALAQRLWLLGVDVWLMGSGDPQTASWWFTLHRGFERPGDSAGCMQWERLFPLKSPTGIWSWHGYALPEHFHWDLSRLYEGQSQRFAARFNIVGPVVSYLQVTFQIAEG